VVQALSGTLRLRQVPTASDKVAPKDECHPPFCVFLELVRPDNAIAVTFAWDGVLIVILRSIVSFSVAILAAAIVAPITSAVRFRAHR
jgi:hypothetical protein